MQELVTSSQIYFVFPCICVVDCLFVCLFVNVTIGDMQVHKSMARPMLLFVKGHPWSPLVRPQRRPFIEYWISLGLSNPGSFWSNERLLQMKWPPLSQNISNIPGLSDSRSSTRWLLTFFRSTAINILVVSKLSYSSLWVGLDLDLIDKLRCSDDRNHHHHLSILSYSIHCIVGSRQLIKLARWQAAHSCHNQPGTIAGICQHVNFLEGNKNKDKKQKHKK